MMQFDRHLVFAGVFDRPFERDFVPIDLKSELMLHPVRDVLRRYRAKRFARFARRERERQSRFADPA